MAKQSKQRITSKKHLARLELERRQVRLIRYIAIGVVLAVVLLIGYGLLEIKVLQFRQPIAGVGKDVITTRDFQLRVRLERQGLINQYIQMQQFAQAFGVDLSSQIQQIQASLDNPLALGQSVLDTMINEKLIRQEAARRDIAVSAEEVEEAIRAVFSFYPEGTPTPTVTPTEVVFPTLSAQQLALVTLTPYPTATPNPTAAPATIPSPTPILTPTPTATPYTVEGYQTALQDTIQQFDKSMGLTEADYRLIFENQLYHDKVFEAISADAPHEEEQVWARHILLPEEAAAIALRERLLKGEDFATLAAELSQDTGSKDSGGDLGWFGRGKMVAEFKEAAYALQVGQISEPVKTDFGWHIIQTLGHEVRPLTAEQYEQARQAKFQEWLTQAREQTEITTYDYWKERVPTDPDLASALNQP